MAKKRPDTQIPPKWLVRVVGIVLLVLALALICIATINFAVIGWPAILMIIGGLTTSGFAAAAIRTGDPVWILLDLILPN